MPWNQPHAGVGGIRPPTFEKTKAVGSRTAVKTEINRCHYGGNAAALFAQAFYVGLYCRGELSPLGLPPPRQQHPERRQP